MITRNSDESFRKTGILRHHTRFLVSLTRRIHTVYGAGYFDDLNCLPVTWFWHIVDTWDQDMRARLLQFVTGSSKVGHLPSTGAYMSGCAQSFEVNTAQCPPNNLQFLDCHRLSSPSLYRCCCLCRCRSQKDSW